MTLRKEGLRMYVNSVHAVSFQLNGRYSLDTMDPQFMNVWIYIQIRQVFTTFFLFALFGYYGSMIHYFWGHTVNTGTAMIWIHYFQRVPAGTLWK